MIKPHVFGLVIRPDKGFNVVCFLSSKELVLRHYDQSLIRNGGDQKPNTTVDIMDVRPNGLGGLSSGSTV
jgi:hypothetical protein